MGQRDSLFVNLDSKELRITLATESADGGEANIDLTSPQMQQIVDWLRTKNVIK
jgi:hypothetical protein